MKSTQGKDAGLERSSGHDDLEASVWVRRFATLIPPGGPVLDIACGRGRNARHFLASGHPVTAIDLDVSGLSDLMPRAEIEILQADLESGGRLPLDGRNFAGVVVTNYLHRPLMPHIVTAVAPGGLLIYETFAAGNERFGRPRNPDFLLRPGELLDAVRGKLRVIAYEDVIVDMPRPAALQRIAARCE